MEPKQWIAQRDSILQNHRLSSMIREARRQEDQMLGQLEDKEVFDYMISKMNFCSRKQAFSYRDVAPSLHLKRGDICFIDFGSAYLMEIGYLHFGLILAFKHNKAFVVPMTGKDSSTISKEHLMALGPVEGLYKDSVLFLNDAKWINTARIIDVKGSLDPEGAKFKQIVKRVLRCISEYATMNP